MTELPPFPIDDTTLNLLEHSMAARYTYDEDNEEFVLIGAEFSVDRLLQFLSGFDPTKMNLIQDGEIPLYEYTGGPLYDEHDVIKALIAEVRRLRDG